MTNERANVWPRNPEERIELALGQRRLIGSAQETLIVDGQSGHRILPEDVRTRIERWLEREIANLRAFSDNSPKPLY